jgi:hypothetical protein
LEFVLTRLRFEHMGAWRADRAMLQQTERELRIRLDWRAAEESALNSLMERALGDDQFFLDLVDFLLRTLSIHGAPLGAILNDHLRQGGSAWTVGVGEDGSFRLVRRVDKVVAEAAEAVMSAAGRAGQHLRKAWSFAYGRNPDPSTAYREAVRAVEAIAGPVVLPKDPKATLGMMIVAIRDAPAKWQVALQPSSGDAVLMLNEVMRLLWTSQLDRHGSADESVPLTVSLEEAQAAVHLSLTLVQWFHSGAIRAK